MLKMNLSDFKHDGRFALLVAFLTLSGLFKEELYRYLSNFFKKI